MRFLLKSTWCPRGVRKVQGIRFAEERRRDQPEARDMTGKRITRNGQAGTGAGIPLELTKRTSSAIRPRGCPGWGTTRSLDDQGSHGSRRRPANMVWVAGIGCAGRLTYT